MTAIKPMGVISNKWLTNGQTAGPAYEAGIENPKRDWEEATLAAKEARKAGMIAAEARGAVEKGIRKAGNAKWFKNAKAVGASRLAQGIANSESEFAAGFAPYHAEIAKTVLKPRGAKGSPENYERSKTMGAALHALKIS